MKIVVVKEVVSSHGAGGGSYCGSGGANGVSGAYKCGYESCVCWSAVMEAVEGFMVLVLNYEG
ncbi:hypothetical protein YC2023_046022 [Brassica napus]